MPTPLLTAADYSNWCLYAGLYVRNLSHADRYRTYQKKLSPAGLVARIAHDFVESNRGGVDLQTWRNSDVYEMGADAEFRVEETARALEAVGAPRVAAKMRTLRNTLLGALFMGNAGGLSALQERMKDIQPSQLMDEFRANVAHHLPHLVEQTGLPLPPPKPVPPDGDIESREQIEHLLERYVQAHAGDLRGDMTRYGDVRAAPGFDPEERMAELDRLRLQEAVRECQKDDVPRMQDLMENIETHQRRLLSFICVICVICG